MMTKILIALLTLCQVANATELHYGDTVKIWSTAWVKPCIYDNDFFNLCGRTGVVIDARNAGFCDGEPLYVVRFDFEKVSSIERNFCSVHLKKVKK